MRQARYLNVILTVNAILLAALLWTQIAGSPLGAEAAATQATPPGIPNSAAQRQQIIDALNDINATVKATNQAVTSGTMKVTVTNLDDLDSGDNGG